MSRCWSTTESPFPGRATSRGISPTQPSTTPPGLYALANAYIGTDLSKDDPKIKEIREEGWANVLSFEQVKYTTLDARLGFEIARKHFRLAGYNAHVDRLNVALIE
jgi:hypothetical protein